MKTSCASFISVISFLIFYIKLVNDKRFEETVNKHWIWWL